MTLETSFDQTSISLPQGHSLPNITAFKPVVHEKNIFSNFCNINIYEIVSPYGVAICDPRDFI